MHSHGIKTADRKTRPNLEFNSTAITIPRQLHYDFSRTYGGRNNQIGIGGDRISKQDAKNLLEATILDISIMAFAIYKNPVYNITATQYVESTLFLFKRNKLLCLYDIKVGPNINLPK